MSGAENNIATGGEKEVLTCPVCMMVITEGIDYLEFHVDSHFSRQLDDYKNLNSNNIQEEAVLNEYLLESNETSCKHANKKMRTQSASSLVANVDENFEYDQIMILDECETAFNLQTNKQHYESDFYKNEYLNYDEENLNLIGKSDYEIALFLDKQEKEHFRLKNNDEINSDFQQNFQSNLFSNNLKNFKQAKDPIASQLLERQQNESLKYKISKENQNELCNYDEDFASEIMIDSQSDSENAFEEHEWLKQKYGMTNIKASTKASKNLDRLLKTHKIDMVTYNYEKEQIDKRINSIFDDGSTCVKDLIAEISNIPLIKTATKRLLCTKCDHYSSGLIDTGYGCGYRNTQILLSSIKEDSLLRDTIFNNNNTNMPSITKIQQLIENAWNNGFDLMGKAQLGGHLKNTAKWIGASDICAMFSSLGIKTELVDIQLCSNSKSSISSILFNFVKNYFEEAHNFNQHVHPIYLQHDGHSRTIVGVEYGKSEHLIMFDPGSRRNHIENLRQNKTKLMQLFRCNLNTFNKKKEYQLLIIKGLFKNNHELEFSKVLTSRKITSI